VRRRADDASLSPCHLAPGIKSCGTSTLSSSPCCLAVSCRCDLGAQCGHLALSLQRCTPTQTVKHFAVHRLFFLTSKATGNSPPGALPFKAKFLGRDLKRASLHFNVPLLPMPGNFFTEVVKGTMACQRLVCAAQLASLASPAQLPPGAVEVCCCAYLWALGCVGVWWRAGKLSRYAPLRAGKVGTVDGLI